MDLTLTLSYRAMQAVNPLTRKSAMIKKRILDRGRIRRIAGGFAFIPHRFLTDGFLSVLTPRQQQLYFFLVLAADRHGLSFYSCDAICRLLQMPLDQYLAARDDLIKKELIEFDGTLFQVLDLPQKPTQKTISHQTHLNPVVQNCIKEVPA
jgi:hypothetical protein